MFTIRVRSCHRLILLLSAGNQTFLSLLPSYCCLLWAHFACNSAGPSFCVPWKLCLNGCCSDRCQILDHHDVIYTINTVLKDQVSAPFCSPTVFTVQWCTLLLLLVSSSSSSSWFLICFFFFFNGDGVGADDPIWSRDSSISHAGPQTGSAMS